VLDAVLLVELHPDDDGQRVLVKDDVSLWHAGDLKTHDCILPQLAGPGGATPPP
jgi:hypothetical protein